MADHLTFTISESYVPGDFPIDRLAEYLSELAAMLGEAHSVHLEALVESSTALALKIDTPAVPKVRERIQAVRAADAPADIMRHYNKLDSMLREDNAVGALALAGDNVLQFPGKTRTLPPPIGPVRQEGAIVGSIYRLGGKDATISIHIRDGERDYRCLETSEAIARELREHLFGSPVRFFGTGTWRRSELGEWRLDKFKVTGFEALVDESLAETVAKLQAIEGSEWADVDDPVANLLAMRGPGGMH